MSEPVVVHGMVEPGFEGVRDAFARNFAAYGDLGAATAAYVGGRKVVDLWGGSADHHGTPYGEDTLQLVFSTTKGVTALVAHLLAQRGELDLDAPVMQYWPEFAAGGKHDIPVRWLLCHKAGLPYVDADLTMEQVLAWDPVVEALARQAPVWQPGTRHGYHAITFGWLVGEVIRRVAGRSVGTFVAEELRGPLGLDLWIGLPDELQPRVARLTNRGPRGRGGGRRAGSTTGEGGEGAAPAGSMGAEAVSGPAGGGGGGGGGPAGAALPANVPVGEAGGPATEDGAADFATLVEQLLGPAALLLRALGGVGDLFTARGVFNRPEVRAAELPAANGVSNARSLAKLYATMIGPVDGHGPLLTPEQIDAVTTVETSGTDKVLLTETTFSLGFQRSSTTSRFGGARAFGHTGAGGSVAFADPDAGIAVAYVMNRMKQTLTGDPRSRSLVRAVYDGAGVTPTFV